jgi:hypothetical protein
MLSQAKVDLAVLYWLWDLAEHDAEAPTPIDLTHMFPNELFSIRRVEVALGELESRGHVESVPDPEAGVYRWQITRDGFGVVDRALRVPTSFIARIASNGATWLESEDAQNAVLKPLARPAAAARSEPSPPGVDGPRINITNTFAPENANSTTNTVTPGERNDSSATHASWANALIALVIGIATIVVTLWVAGKL